MTIKTDWQRVSHEHPCPICGQFDGCLVHGQPPEAAICAQIESRLPVGPLGWLHHLRDDGPTWSPRTLRIERSAARMAKACDAKVPASPRRGLPEGRQSP